MEKIFINSLPKSGTNLVEKLAFLLGYKFSNLSLASSTINGRYSLAKEIIRGKKLNFSRSNLIDIGQEIKAEVKEKWLINQLLKVQADSYITGHASYSKRLNKILDSNKIKIVMVIRDPRDVLVSAVNYVGLDSSVSNYPTYFRKLPFEERLRFIISGGEMNGIYFNPFSVKLSHVCNWLNVKGIFIMRFEDLIGCQGGGDENQKLKKIVEFLEFCGASNLENLSAISDNLFGGTKTFRSGRIGTWRTELNDDMIKLVNKNIYSYLSPLGYH